MKKILCKEPGKGFEKISLLIDAMNESTFVSGCGHRKSIQQKQYQELQGYLERAKTVNIKMNAVLRHPKTERYG